MAEAFCGGRTRDRSGRGSVRAYARVSVQTENGTTAKSCPKRVEGRGGEHDLRCSVGRPHHYYGYPICVANLTRQL